MKDFVPIFQIGSSKRNNQFSQKCSTMLPIAANPAKFSVSSSYMENRMYSLDDASPACSLVLPERTDEWPSYLEGSLFQSAVIEGSSRLQVPPSMVIATALGAMSAACQALIDIKQPVGHHVQASLMLLTIADSGERKTTVEKRFFKALRDWQRIMQDKAEKDEDRYIYEEEIWKLEDKTLKTEFKKLIKNNLPNEELKEKIENHRHNRPYRLPYKRLLYDDTTPQALIQLMHRHSSNACLVSSEANSIFSGHALREIHHLNTMWDGNDIIVDRVSTSSIFLRNPRLTLALMTQPSVVDRFLNKRGDEARGMGFLARFLVVKPQKMSGNRTIEPIGHLPHIDKFNRRIKEILEQTQDIDSKQHTIEYTADAAELWKKYSQKIEKEMSPDRLYSHHPEHASKLMDNVSRVAAILHTFEGKEKSISLETLKFSYKLCLRYSREFIDHLAGEPTIVTHANLLVNFLLDLIDKENKPNRTNEKIHGLTLKHGRYIEFSPSIIKQHGPNPLRNNANRDAAMALLTRMGHLVQNGNRYRFSETILGHQSPNVKNGEAYFLNSLPLYSHQHYYCPSRSTYLNQHRYMIIIAKDYDKE
ncbi:YfjI family protein [Kushneria marisflavi]|uniref:Uncharacterized protein n=1 Tax=Kushneria marisflavi TaxID=157779 RepID=A0A240UPU5_9GAMM|nr:YfjI family protein [Kushneria marisflavi]ART63156.1 hypothetical protein B9H00_08885 [Kushneria marisflavi]RKD84586.1 uncharacterized protein DUF3987 [Kushneria marisflavi]